MLVTLYKMSEVHFRLLGMNGFLLRSHVIVSTLTSRFHVLIWQTTSKTCHQERAVILVFLIQPIKSLICGVVVAVDVVIS